MTPPSPARSAYPSGPVRGQQRRINQRVRAFAAEWAPHDIRINAVAPGYLANIMAGVNAHPDPLSDERISTFVRLIRRHLVAEIAAP